MDKKTLALNTSLSDEDNNISSKLRRLHIQEALFLQSIQKPDKTVRDEDHSSPSSYTELLKKAKDSYINLKNLYDEVKANTQSQELLADIDIDEIKKKVLDLDSRIKTFKSEINSELANLKQTELHLNNQLLENPNEVENLKRRPKTKSHSYNAIVPSPVRAMMTSPFKCSDVQQFQEFMQNSPNRYGGWNEYNHNLFVKQWQKLFGKKYYSEFESETFEQSVTYDIFIGDLMPKMRGITLSAISAHAQWYVKYLFYKDKQQNAIDKWKWSKQPKKVPKKGLSNGSLGTSTNTTWQHWYADEEDSPPMVTIKEPHRFLTSESNESPRGSSVEYETKTKPSIGKDKRPHSILKPTKQWLNRFRHDDSDNGSSSSYQYHSIEILEKQLATPHWRLGL